MVATGKKQEGFWGSGNNLVSWDIGVDFVKIHQVIHLGSILFFFACILYIN